MLGERGHQVGREVSVPIYFRNVRLTEQRVDMIVDAKVVVECKATDKLPAFAERQLFNYLRATRIEVGMLLHFGPAPKFYRVIASRASLRRGERGTTDPQMP